jgi:hypothetical protein
LIFRIIRFKPGSFFGLLDGDDFVAEARIRHGAQMIPFRASSLTLDNTLSASL